LRGAATINMRELFKIGIARFFFIFIVGYNLKFLIIFSLFAKNFAERLVSLRFKHYSVKVKRLFFYLKISLLQAFEEEYKQLMIF
jgi:hypothetical protein